MVAALLALDHLRVLYARGFWDFDRDADGNDILGLPTVYQVVVHRTGSRLSVCPSEDIDCWHSLIIGYTSSSSRNSTAGFLSEKTNGLLPPRRCSPGCQDTSSLDGDHVFSRRLCSTEPFALGHAEAIRAPRTYTARAAEKLTKAQHSIGGAVFSGGLGLLNESIVTTDTLHPIRRALWSRPGARARTLASSRLYYRMVFSPLVILSLGLRARTICLVAAPFLQFPCFSSGTPLSRRCDNHRPSTRIPTP